MRVLVAMVGVVALMAIATAAQSTASQASTIAPEHALPARSMVKGKVVPKKPKGPPKAAEAAAAAKAVPKAPKDEIIRWVRKEFPKETEGAYTQLHMYLNGQLIFTFDDLMAKGSDAVQALTIPDKFRAAFMDLMLKHIAKVHSADDGLMVPTPKLVKAAPPKPACPKKNAAAAPRFAQVPVPPNGLVGDWLRRNFPDIKPLRMSRTVLALERQSVKTFQDLKRVGLNGIQRLLYVPDGVREALREAVIYELGLNNGHDDGLMVPTVKYVPPAPGKEESCN